MLLHNYMDVLHMFMTLQSEQGTSHSNFIPLLTTNDMLQPGCVCCASVCIFKPLPLYPDAITDLCVHGGAPYMCERGTMLSDGLTW